MLLIDRADPSNIQDDRYIFSSFSSAYQFSNQTALSQPQRLMFGSGFSEFHIEQEFAVNLYR